MAVFGTKSKQKLKGLEADLILLLGYSIKDAPIDFSIDYGLRDTKEQQKLYSWGRTVVNPNTGAIPSNKYGMIVTNKDGIIKKSNHQSGKAVDIYPYYNGSMHTNDVKSLKIIIEHIKKCAKELNISAVFGIDWKSPYDPPHIELE